MALSSVLPAVVTIYHHALTLSSFLCSSMALMRRGGRSRSRSGSGSCSSNWFCGLLLGRAIIHIDRGGCCWLLDVLPCLITVNYNGFTISKHSGINGLYWLRLCLALCIAAHISKSTGINRFIRVILLSYSTVLSISFVKASISDFRSLVDSCNLTAS